MFVATHYGSTVYGDDYGYQDRSLFHSLVLCYNLSKRSVYLFYDGGYFCKYDFEIFWKDFEECIMQCKVRINGNCSCSSIIFWYFWFANLYIIRFMSLFVIEIRTCLYSPTACYWDKNMFIFTNSIVGVMVSVFVVIVVNHGFEPRSSQTKD